MVPFVPPYSQAAVDELRFRLRRHDGPKPFVAPGLPRVWIVNSSKTCARGYWMDAFDWKAQQELLSTLHQYALNSVIHSGTPESAPVDVMQSFQKKVLSHRRREGGRGDPPCGK